MGPIGKSGVLVCQDLIADGEMARWKDYLECASELSIEIEDYSLGFQRKGPQEHKKPSTYIWSLNVQKCRSFRKHTGKSDL